MNLLFMRNARNAAHSSFFRSKRMGWAFAASAVLSLAACGGGDSSAPSSETEAKYSVSGTVSGLHGVGLVLQTNTGQTVSVAADGRFTLPGAFSQGSTYAVTVKTQPTSPLQTCTVGNASGTVGNADISDLLVTCSTEAFSVSGSVSGLAGSGLVIQNNAGDELAIHADGDFAFPVKVASGARYAVTVKTQPDSPAQTCTVARAAGTVVDRNVADVAIICATNTYTIGGSVSGLAGRTGLVLQNNASDDLTVDADGAFVFSTPVASGGTFLVTVKTPPQGLTCTVDSHPNTPVTSNVTDVQVNCSPVRLQVGGEVVGLTGSGLVLQNNGTDDLALSGSGPFQFTQPVAYGSRYAVSIKAQPTPENCIVTNGNGSATAPVSNVVVSCTSLRVTTLAGSGAAGSNDGMGTAATFSGPSGIASDSAGNLYVTQMASGRGLRKISPTGQVSTVVSGLDRPVGVTVSSSGEIYVVTSERSQQILKVSPDTGQFTVFAGGNPSGGSVDGKGSDASFAKPFGLTSDSDGNLYVTEVAGHRIRKISPNGDVTTLAGDGSGRSIDGTGNQASFNEPAGITFGPDGNLYVTEQRGHKIRKVTLAGQVTTLAGSGIYGSTDGTGLDASFLGPFGITADAAGVLYVTEILGSKIRRISPNGVVTTLAGTDSLGYEDGPANTARFEAPAGILLDSQNNLFVTEYSGNRIRKISR